MIFVSEFSRHSSVWRQAAPTLEQFVRWSNSNYASLGASVQMNSPPERNSLIAEVAFRLAEAQFVPDPLPASEVERTARNMILRLPRGSAALDQLHPWEWHEASALGAAIRNYVSQLPSLAFSPIVPGCGVVDQSVADIKSDDRLIEVKSVKRPFRGSDFRQVMTYAAMYYASGVPISTVTILNPRLGDVLTVSMEDLAVGVSGRSAVELLQDLVTYMIELQVSA